ncbi:MAG: hypothetical protein AAF483_29065, partial [Planctomycetota bacterium]
DKSFSKGSVGLRVVNAHATFSNFKVTALPQPLSSKTESEIPEDWHLKIDVVSLQNGKTVPGLPTITADYQGYRYFFQSNENKDVFEQAPLMFAVQMDGGCGRMGSMSGRGLGNLWHLHDSKLYVFASEACRKTFIKNPEQYLEVDDTAREFSSKEIDEGKQAFASVIEAHGGADAIRELNVISRLFQEQVKAGTATYDHLEKWTFDFGKSTFSTWDSWNDLVYIQTMTPSDRYFATRQRKGMAEQRRPMFGAAQREATRIRNRQLVVILKAMQRDDFRVAAISRDNLGRQRLLTEFDGCSNILTIDQDTGLVIAISYRGRGPQMSYGLRTDWLSDYEKVASVQLATTQIMEFDDEKSDSKTYQWVQQ